MICYDKPMISITKLIEERDAKRQAFCDKYEAKIALLKEESNSKIATLVEEYSLTHSKEETEAYKRAINNDEILRINKVVRRYEKKIARYYRKTDIKKKVKNSNRVWEIDYLRGFAIWGMIVDHFLFNFYDLYEYFFDNFRDGWAGKVQLFAFEYWVSDVRITFRLLGVILFVFLCGVSSSFSRNNYKRSFGLIALGGLITLFSYIFGIITDDMSWHIFISTLTGIGLCLLIYSLCETLFTLFINKKYWKWFALTAFIGIMVMWGFVSAKTYLNNQNTMEMYWDRFFFIFNGNGADITTYAGVEFSPLSQGWTYEGFKYLTSDNWYHYVIGTRGFGSDWLGIFPFTGYVFLGGFVGETLYADKKSFIKFFYPKEQRKLTGEEFYSSPLGQMNAMINKILCGVTYPGRNTLLVYIAHQPVIILIMSIILMISGYKLNLGDMLSSMLRL